MNNPKDNGNILHWSVPHTCDWVMLDEPLILAEGQTLDMPDGTKVCSLCGTIQTDEVRPS